MTGQPMHTNPNWKGGRSVASNGYVLIKDPAHPHADVRGYVYEHRMVAVEHLGRPLAAGGRKIKNPQLDGATWVQMPRRRTA